MNIDSAKGISVKGSPAIFIFAEKQDEAAADHGILSSGIGIKCSALCIPVKYMHTPVEVIDCSDVENTGILLAEFIKEVSENG